MKNRNTCLITVGSCGTKWLEKIGLVTPPGGNSQGKRNYGGAHCRFPNQVYEMGYRKVIYLIADPIETIISYWNRGFMQNKNHLLNMSGNFEDFDSFKNHPQNILSWSMFDKKPFMLHQHYLKWTTQNIKNFDVMFIKYETLSDNFENLSTFLNDKKMSEKICTNFKFRGYRKENLSTNIRTNLERKYLDEIEFYNNIGKCKIFRGKK